MEPIVARKMWRTLEPYHGLIYFAPEGQQRYEALGVTGFSGYFASRAAPMGAVAPAVIEATFYNFAPSVVRAAIPAAWDAATPTQLTAARLEAADAALRRIVGDAVDGAEMVRAAELAEVAARAIDTDGRPIAAALAALDWPDRPHIALWHAIAILREYRGDGHVACLVTHRLDGLESLVLHSAMGEIPRDALLMTRGWSLDEWDAAVERLSLRGLVDAEGAFTDEGRAVRDGIEQETDELSLTPWMTLGQDDCNELRALVRPWSRAVVEGGTFGFG